MSAPPVVLLLSLVLCLAGCADRTKNLATSRALPDAGAMAPDGAVDAAIENDAGAVVIVMIDAGVVYCGSERCPCSNGRDDDGDGLVDALDPECTGPSDQFEDSLAIGTHGEDQDSKCQDCFFDNNSGSGDDGCNRPRSCATDPAAVAVGTCSSCEVSGNCEARCVALTPNGCDCFGCCAVFRAGVSVNVLLRASCALDAIDDLTACPRCEQARDCLNPCGPCELCTGRSAAELPPSCADPGGPGFRCDEGAVCVEARDCESGQFCQLGCCVTLAI
jgi:hypothetical protein